MTTCIERNTPHLQAIAHEVDAQYEVAARVEDGKLFIMDEDVSLFIDIIEEYSGSKWSSRKTGKLRIAVGSYGNRQSYPQRKDGTFKYDAMATTLYWIARRRIAQRVASQVQATNQLAASAFVAQHLKNKYGAFRVEPSAVVEKPLRVRIDIDQAMTVEQAETLHAALAKFL